MEQAFTLHLFHQSLYAWLQPPLTCKSSTGLQFAPRHAEPSITGDGVSRADYKSEHVRPITVTCDHCDIFICAWEGGFSDSGEGHPHEVVEVSL